ncbi:MAG: elongation factor G [Planctomycetota bacterium]|nr:elongation factor G [Planctomycetota bacterium]MDA1137897.1 elongation factor G [Planctomycetota bacterium]
MSDASKFHNVALVGHGGCGKTTLMESLLFKAGAISRKGNVNDGTSVGLVEDEEKVRKITLNCNLFQAGWKNHSINFLDSPGYTDFIAGSIVSLAVADVAIICVSAVSGIEVNTRKAWKIAEERGVPVAIAITRMDGDNARFQATLASIRETFSEKAAEIFIPDGDGSAFSKIASVMNPAGNEEAAILRESLLESIIEADEDLLMRYLDGEQISDDEVHQAFGQAVAARSVIPAIPVSAEKEIGLEELLDAIINNMPSAAMTSRNGKVSSDEDADETTREAGNDSFSALVFRVLSDKFVGKQTYFRVISGSFSSSSQTYNSRSGGKSKIGGLYTVAGGELKGAESVSAGQIGVISKVDDITVSDTLCDENSPVIFEPIKFPTPMVSLAIEPKSRGDEGKISDALSSLVHEDPTFQTHRDVQTKEMIIAGVGTLHLDVMMARMKSRFGVEVDTREPKIPYLETITLPSESHYRHKKQSGGRGQFGDIYIRMSPNERGAGFEFVNAIVGGAVPNNFIPAVEKGLLECMGRSAFAGFPAVDIRVELYDGSYHAVDSDEQSFKIAARGAYREAFMKSKPVLLEPIVHLEVSIPSKFMGDISSDLNRRRAHITGMDVTSDHQIIKAVVPLSEVTSYSTELRSITGGEGDFSLEPSHYDIVPAHTAQEVVKKYKKAEEEEH